MNDRRKTKAQLIEELNELRHEVEQLKSLEIAYSKLQKIEERLKASQERYEIAVRGSNDGLWDWDLLTNEVHFSSRWKRMIGYEVDEIDDDLTEFESRLHPDDYERVMTTISNYLGGQLPAFEVEFRFQHKDGSYRWILARGAALRDAEGRSYRLAGSHTDITARKQAEIMLQKRATELETVAQVSAAASTLLDTDTLLQEVVDLTKERFNLYHAHIYLLAEADEALVLTAGAGEAGHHMVAEGWRIPLNHDHSLVARAAQTRQGFIVNDVRQEPDFLPNPLLPDTRAELAVPMLVGQQVVGVLDIQADQVDYFTGEDIRIQTILAGQIAVALQNARLFSQSQRRAERERLINQVTQKIQGTVTVESALQTAVKELGQALQARQTRVVLTAKEEETDRIAPNGDP